MKNKILAVFLSMMMIFAFSVPTYALDTNTTVQEETSYIQKMLEKFDVKVSRLSYGIPMGTDIEYLDPIMITKAWEDRKVIS